MTSAGVDKLHRAAVRVPQEERTRAMRQRLLEATVDCLVEHGWSGTSTTLVSQRAGVSRGAQLHHFPTKNDLVLAAVEHLSELRGDELREAAAQLPTGKRRTRAVLEMFADHFTGPVFTGRARAVGRGPQRRGAARGRRTPRAAGGSRGAPHRRRRPGVRREQAAGARAGPGDPRPGPWPRPGQHDHRRHGPAPQDPRRLGAHPRHRAEAAHDHTDRPGRPRPGARRPRRARVSALEAMVAHLDDAGWRTPTPAPGWDIATQVAHLAWTDEVAVVAATDKQAWDALVLEAIGDPDGVRRRAGARGREGRAGRRARALAGRPPAGCRRRCAASRRARRCRGSGRR